MKMKRTEVDGDRVVHKAGSEAAAKALAADLESEAQRTGTIDERINWLVDKLDDIGGSMARPVVWIIALGVYFIAARVAWVSWGRLFPIETIGTIASLFGVLFMTICKISTGRWARASFRPDDEFEGAGFWQTLAFGGAAIEVTVLVFYGFATIDDGEANRQAWAAEIEILRGDAKEARREARAMPRPQDSAEILQAGLDDKLRGQVHNLEGVPTGRTVGEITGYDTPGFCLPQGQFVTLRAQECPDLLDQIRDLQRRVAYENRIDEAKTLDAKADALALNPPKKSSTAAAGEQLDDGDAMGALVRALSVAGIMAIIIAMMMVTTFASVRYPLVNRKGGAA